MTKPIKKIKGAELHAKMKTMWRKCGSNKSGLRMKADALEIENKRTGKDTKSTKERNSHEG